MQSLGIYMDDVKSLCQKHKVDRCYLFGSAATGQMTESSDVDFLVRFKVSEIRDYFSNYLRLKESLSELLGRNVDLVEEQALKNPILIRSIERSKSLVYG